MLKAKKQHDYLICIDSDGTIMDSMTIKHEKCFGPCFIKVFDIKEHVDEILKKWNDINLYRLTRGINRFQGLKQILTYVMENFQLRYEGYEHFFSWVEKTGTFSTSLLKKELDKYPNDEVIQKALEWSYLVNEEISMLPPFYEFEHVNPCLARLASFSDLLGVSSANKDAVIKEWTKQGLAPFFMDIACQDVGSKSNIIKQALELGYDLDNVIMIGDALGDENAAKENGVSFYPIIPSQEVRCWSELENKYADYIESGRYHEVKDRLVKQFHTFLDNGGK